MLIVGVHVTFTLVELTLCWNTRLVPFICFMSMSFCCAFIACRFILLITFFSCNIFVWTPTSFFFLFYLKLVFLPFSEGLRQKRLGGVVCLFVFIFPQRKGGEKHQSVASCLGLNPQPRYVLWLRIKPVIFCFSSFLKNNFFKDFIYF